MKRRFVFYAMVILGMLLLLYLMELTHEKIKATAETLGSRPYSVIWMSLWGFLFGALMEWKSLFNLIKGYIHVNWKLLIPAIVLAAVTFIPGFYWAIWYGVGQPFYIEMLWKPEIQMLLNAFSGLLLIRSLGQK